MLFLNSFARNFSFGKRALSHCLLLPTVLALTVQAYSIVTSPAAAAATATEEGPEAVMPLAEVPAEAENAIAQARELRAELNSDHSIEAVAKNTPRLAREIDARASENRKIIAQRPPLEILDALEGDWRRLRRNLSASTREVTARVTRVERQIGELEDVLKVWDRTLETAQSSAAPAEILSRIENVRGEIRQAREEAQQERARALTVQSRLAAQDARIADGLALIARARDDVLNHLFISDGMPIWSAEPARNSADILNESRGSISRQNAALSIYAERQASRLLAHLLLLIGLTVAFYWARAKARHCVLQEASPWTAPPVFERPIAVAFLLSSLFIPWLYPEAPRLLSAFLGLLATSSRRPKRCDAAHDLEGLCRALYVTSNWRIWLNNPYRSRLIELFISAPYKGAKQPSVLAIFEAEGAD
jgi:hypothetical protein